MRAATLYRTSTLFDLSCGMSWFDLSLREQLLVGASMALTFAVFYVAGLQVGGHW
jgi:hypothetical protein